MDDGLIRPCHVSLQKLPLHPRSQEELDRRNRVLAAGEFSTESGEYAAKRRQVHNLLNLPDYDHLLP